MTGVAMRSVRAVTVVWGVVFALVHFYWAADGTIANDPSGQSLADSAYIAFIAVLGLLGALVAYGLYRRRDGRVGRRRLVLLARLGGVVLLLGVAGGVGRWIASASIGNDGATGVVITAYFLLGGLLFSALGWRDASSGTAEEAA